VLGADEVLSFAGKDTNVKSRRASASARVDNSSAEGNEFTAMLYLFSDPDKARAYAYKSKGGRQRSVRDRGLQGRRSPGCRVSGV